MQLQHSQSDGTNRKPSQGAGHQSIWKAAAPDLAFAPLAGDVEADVAIVGGGITGILSAHLLARAGQRVVVLEAGRIGEGTTGNSTGNLYAMTGDRTRALRGAEEMAAVWRARRHGVELIRQTVAERGIDCAFVTRPWVLFSEQEPEPPAYEHVRRIAQRVGLPVRDARGELPFKVASALGIDGQAQFNPLAFVKRLASGIQGERCRVHEGSRVVALEQGERCVLRTAQGTVTAPWVILATHTPKGVLKLQAALSPHREYGIAATLRGGGLPGGICWSAGSSRHSLRSFAIEGRDYLVVVGEHHKTGQQEDTQSCVDALASYARKHFELDEVKYRWSAQGYYAADGLPHIGESALAPNILIATGYAADGLTYGAVAALILSDRIQGRRNDTAGLFEAGRVNPLDSAKDFITENVNVLGQYLKDLPGKAQAHDFADVGRGEGKTVSVSGEKLAVHRDADGMLHVVSAVCTHMQCIVAWNGAEQSWDCPCHGSRFSVEGTVLEGPAMTDLAPRAPGRS